MERICESAEVRRAARLRDFLHYVSRRTLEQPEVPVSEQEIGVHVFERPADYDTGVDNIVRVNASELRKRITAYFAAEGAREPVWFDIPRGSYAPRFFIPETSAPPTPPTTGVSVPIEHAVMAIQADTARIEAHPLPASTSSPSGVERRLLFALIGVLLCACIALAIAWRSAAGAAAVGRGGPTVRAFWSPVLESSRTTDVVLADTSFTQAEDVLGHQIPLDQYLKHTYVTELNQSQLAPEFKSAITALVDRNYGSFGDFQVARRILSLAPRSPNLNLVYARTLEPPTLKTDNLVLIGSSYSNPWSSLFESRLNFLVVSNGFHQLMSVTNRQPGSGEQASYEAPAQAGASVGYSVVASLPSEDGHGEVILLEGTSAEATEAAGEFLTSEDQLRHLQSVMHEPSLRHFEVLLRTTRLAATPLSAEIVAWRKR